MARLYETVCTVAVVEALYLNVIAATFKEMDSLGLSVALLMLNPLTSVPVRSICW